MPATSRLSVPLLLSDSSGGGVGLAASSLVLWAALMVIPVVLGWFVGVRRNVPFPGVLWMFCLFVGLTGLVFLADVAGPAGWPWLPLAARILAATAAWSAAAALVLVMPQAIRKRKNEDLQRELEREHRALAAVSESEARFRLLAENLGLVVWMLDLRAGKVLYVSPAYQDIWGREPRALYADPTDWLAGIHPEDRPRVQRAFEAGAALGTYSEEYRVVHPDGSLRWVRDRGYPIPPAAGAVERVCGVAIDITEERLAQAAVRDTEALYESLVENLPVCVLRKDVHGRFTFANQAFCDLRRQPREEIVGRTDYDFFPADLAEKYRRDDAQVMATGSTQEFIEAFEDQGQRRTVQVLKTPVHDAQGKVVGTQILFFDISDRVRAEQEVARHAAELAHANAELARSNADLKKFAYVASHDLQAPLRAIAGYCQLLNRKYRGRLDAKGAEYLDAALSGAQRMQELIAGLLAYCQVQAQATTPVAVPAGEPLREALANLAAAIEEAGAIVQAEPLPVVRADRLQLVRLFQNLLSNAIKFRAADRPPVVRVSACRQDGQWRLTVADNGVGIDAAHAEAVFELFHRLESAAPVPGTGIGLAECQRIVERHGGRLWFEAAPGGGTAFHFTLPAAADQQG